MSIEDNKVVVRGTLTGTNEGSLIGMPATSRKATWTAIHSFRLAGGKVVEHWGNVDMMGLMTQLGHIPS
jgi:predicted ester cyclase